MATINLRVCGEIPLIKHPSSASGDCAGLENTLVKGGSTATWTLPPESFVPVNPSDPYWGDEETDQYIVLEDGTQIEMA
jgi:hypothetical protein